MARIADDLIYDLGLHDGQDTDFYLKKGFRVVAVEANPDLAELCRRRFADAIADGRLTLLNVAITWKAGDVTFYVNRMNSKWSSIHLDWARRGSKGYDAVTVPGCRLQDIVAEHGVPRYLKIDIEGADKVALESIWAFPARPRFVSVEGGGEGFLTLMTALGYDRFAAVNQAQVPALAQPATPREGRAAAHVFPMGASGPFGREVQAPWMTLEEARAERAAFVARIAELEARHQGDPEAVRRGREELGLGWYDMHAARAEDLA